MDCGWRLAKRSWRLLRSARTLIALGLGLSLSAGVVAYADLALRRGHGGSLAALVGLAFAGALSAVFLSVMLALTADQALDGSRMTLFEAGAEARERLASVLGWTAIATSVGVGLLLLGSVLPARAGFFLSLAAAGWSFATFLVVPMLALDLATPIEALREVPFLVKQRWGEEFAGLFGIGGVAALASIPVGILLAAGAHRDRIAPGSADLAVVSGAIGLAAIFVLASTSAQVFAVALYRDATVGFPDTHAYVERRPRRRSWVVRIGLVLLAGLLTLAAVAAILGPRPTGKEFKISLPTRYARFVTAGMPVVYEGHEVGEVQGSEISGENDVISFEVEDQYRSLETSTSITLSGFEGRPCLLIVPRGQAPPAPAENGGTPSAGPA
jgi:hypothetical protein